MLPFGFAPIASASSDWRHERLFSRTSTSTKRRLSGAPKTQSRRREGVRGMSDGVDIIQLMKFTSHRESVTLRLVRIPISEFADEGVLTTREAGERARHSIERHIASLRTPNEVVALDFGGIKAISAPFAEQSIGLLLSGRLAGYYEEHPFVILEANRDVRETIGTVLRLRHLSVLSITRDDGAELLGAEETLRNTMETAVQLGDQQGDFSVNDLARELHLSAQAANNRLKQLVQSGALARRRVSPDRGGRQFRYIVPALDEEDRGSLSAPGQPGRTFA